MSFWDSLRISASALTAQRLRLDVISNNIANAETTRTAQGGPYKREDVVFTTQASNSLFPALVMARRDPAAQNSLAAAGVQVQQIVTDSTPGPRVYDPTHPDADANGYVTYPNVNIVSEMTNMLSATRSYEAAMSALEASKRMALRALDISSTR
jgi:flagellar basal-body rod protein FlgC